MTTECRTRTVDASPQAVVDHLCDVGHAEERDPGTGTSTRHDEGLIALGTTG